MNINDAQLSPIWDPDDECYKPAHVVHPAQSDEEAAAKEDEPVEKEDTDSWECSVELGAMMRSPIWGTHNRSKNWLAIIKRDPTSPGGLHRVFMKPARGSEFYYMIDGLEVGHAVEFGADYYTSRGRKDPERWYGIVVEKSEYRLVLKRYKTAVQACKAAQETKNEHVSR